MTDAYIAATADLLDDTVLTRNVADFETLSVEVETYSADLTSETHVPSDLRPSKPDYAR